MLEKVPLEEDTGDIISFDEKEMTFNGFTYKMLKQKKKRLESHKKEGEKIEDLLYYLISRPIKIDKKKEISCTITKDALNKFFLEAETKRCSKDIYNTSLYKLLNPYYLVTQKKYIDIKNISEEIKEKFTDCMENLFERENNMDYNKFYDKSSKSNLELVSTNKTDNEIVQESIRERRLLVRLKNEGDEKQWNLLLPSFTTVGELKTIVKFLYRSSLFVDNLNDLKLSYLIDNKMNEKFLIDDHQTLFNIAKELNSVYELKIFIQADY